VIGIPILDKDLKVRQCKVFSKPKRWGIALLYYFTGKYTDLPSREIAWRLGKHDRITYYNQLKRIENYRKKSYYETSFNNVQMVLNQFIADENKDKDIHTYEYYIAKPYASTKTLYFRKCIINGTLSKMEISKQDIDFDCIPQGKLNPAIYETIEKVTYLKINKIFLAHFGVSVNYIFNFHLKSF